MLSFVINRTIKVRKNKDNFNAATVLVQSNNDTMQYHTGNNRDIEEESLDNASELETATKRKPNYLASQTSTGRKLKTRTTKMSRRAQTPGDFSSKGLFNYTY